MSKAFTREDDLPDPVVPRRLPSPLPPGAKNYMTPGGMEALRAELNSLVEEERPQAATAPAGSERLQALDERIDSLRRSLESAVVVNAPAGEDDRVRFGATVTVREQPGGEESRYRIVGFDETDVERGWVSWLSPIAKALLQARIGECVAVRLPSSEKKLEVVAIAYE